MQKKLIALAIAGLASTAAFAQSNVTIYGVADATFDSVTASKEATGTFERANRVSANSSYIGFKGTEALGNGLSAVFQFENTVAFDTGAAITGNRDSYVGVAGGFGTVLAGTLTGPTRALGASVDVFSGATGIGANSGLLGKLGNNLTNVTNGNITDNNGGVSVTANTRSQTQTSMFDTRWKNAIAYVSPTVNGFTGVAAYVANENHSTTVDTSGYDLGLNYANAPVKVGISYNNVSLRNNAAASASLNSGNNLTAFGTDVKASDVRVAGSYDFGVATVRAIYDRVEAKGSLLTIKQNVWGLGGTYSVTAAGKVVGQYYKANDVTGLDGNQDARLWALGYEHSLSKRTILKATYAHLSNGSAANYDFGVNATGGSVSNSTVSGIQLGVRHSF